MAGFRREANLRPSLPVRFRGRPKSEFRQRAARMFAGAVIVTVVLAALALQCDIYQAAGGNGLQFDGSALRQLLKSIGRENR